MVSVSLWGAGAPHRDTEFQSDLRVPRMKTKDTRGSELLWIHEGFCSEDRALQLLARGRKRPAGQQLDLSWRPTSTLRGLGRVRTSTGSGPGVFGAEPVPVWFSPAGSSADCSGPSKPVPTDQNHWTATDGVTSTLVSEPEPQGPGAHPQLAAVRLDPPGSDRRRLSSGSGLANTPVRAHGGPDRVSSSLASSGPGTPPAPDPVQNHCNPAGSRF